MDIFLTTCAGAAALIGIGICVISLYKRDTQKSVFFNFLSSAIALYLIGNYLEITSRSVEAALVGVKISYLGIPFIPPLWYLCVREYCGKKIRNTFFVAAIMVVPVVITVLAQTWESNHLLFTDFIYKSGSQISQLSFFQGPLYPLKQIYLYFFNFLGIATILAHYAKGTRRFRQQAVFFFVSALIPAFTTATIPVNIGEHWVDLTPYGLSVTIALFYLTLHRYGIENFSSIIKDNVVENLSEGVLLFDKEGIYMDSNHVIKTIFPETLHIPLGTSIEDMEYLPFGKSILIDDKASLREFSKEHNEYIRTYSLSVSPVQVKGNVIGYSVIIYNITPFKNMMDELTAKAHVDALTSIYNRGFFFEKGAYEVVRAQRAQSALSLIIFNLDDFKSINDIHGHPCGDYVLKTVALIGKQNLRKTDIFGRYGGEEFCILLPDTNAEGAHIKAEAVRKKISTYAFEHEKTRLHITASFGVATFDHNAENETLETLIKRADTNLYKAKSTGKNMVV